YIEGAARGQKDKAFALKAMGRTFRTDDRELLEESYDMIIKSNFVIPPYPSVPGIANLLKGLKQINPKAKTPQPEDFAHNRLAPRDRSKRVCEIGAGGSLGYHASD